MAQDIIHRFETPSEVAKAVADAFVEYTTDCIKRTGSCIVAVSGGTTPNALFELLNTDVYMDQIDWENIFFLWVDERFVPHSNPDSNFHRAKERLFAHMGGSCHFYPVPTDEGTVDEAARAYEKEVATVLRACDKKRLDLALLGLGDDGHTASLFPRSVVLSELARRVVPVTDGKVWERVTMTFAFLSQAETVWFTVVGESKRAALTKVLHQRLDYEDEPWQNRITHVLPGAVLNQDEIHWYIDASASGE